MSYLECMMPLTALMRHLSTRAQVTAYSVITANGQTGTLPTGVNFQIGSGSPGEAPSSSSSVCMLLLPASKHQLHTCPAISVRMTGHAHVWRCSQWLPRCFCHVHTEDRHAQIPPACLPSMAATHRTFRPDSPQHHAWSWLGTRLHEDSASCLTLQAQALHWPNLAKRSDTQADLR